VSGVVPGVNGTTMRSTPPRCARARGGTARSSAARAGPHPDHRRVPAPAASGFSADLIVETTTPAELLTRTRAKSALWARVVREANVKPE
jgi:hypothetical protein